MSTSSCMHLRIFPCWLEKETHLAHITQLRKKIWQRKAALQINTPPIYEGLSLQRRAQAQQCHRKWRNGAFDVWLDRSSCSFAALEGTNPICVITTQNVTTICLSQVTLLIFKLQPENSNLKIMAWNVSEGCHLKADYFKEIMRGGILFHDTCDCMSYHHQDNTGAVVWCRHHRPLPLSSQIHYLGNRKVRKLLIKDVPTLWLLQAVCRHLKPSVSSPLKEKWRKKNNDILISRQRKSSSWQQPNSPATGEEKGREEEKDWAKTTHEDTFEDIFTHSLYVTSPYLMSFSYCRLPGFCWFPLRSGETPCGGSKGEEVSALLACQKYEPHSEWLTCLSVPHPMAALPHYPLNTHYNSKFKKCM